MPLITLIRRRPRCTGVPGIAIFLNRGKDTAPLALGERTSNTTRSGTSMSSCSSVTMETDVGALCWSERIGQAV
jgi:hypothetical protein